MQFLKRHLESMASICSVSSAFAFAYESIEWFDHSLISGLRQRWNWQVIDISVCQVSIPCITVCLPQTAGESGSCVMKNSGQAWKKALLTLKEQGT